MPPEGYDTVTLPTNLVERLDSMGDEMNNPSRASVILTCLNAYERDDGTAQDVDLEPVLNRIDDLENTLPRKLKEELR